MIKNSAVLVLALMLAGCARAQADEPASFQGIVEFEETKLAFELGGRVREVHVKEGDQVAASTKVATLDDELDRSAREARAREAEAAHSQVDVVQAGVRPEEIASMAARVRAAQAAEDLLSKNLERQRALLARGAAPQATVDDLEGQLARATAERQALEQNLTALRRGARKVDVRAAETKAQAVAASVALDDVRLSRHELSAPRGGTVLDVHVDPGEVIAAGTPVLTLADTSAPYVDVFVPQGKIGAIRVGKNASVRVDSLSKLLSAKVEHISRRTEFTPRFLFSERERPNLVVRVRVRIADPKQELHAGIPAFVTIQGAH